MNKPAIVGFILIILLVASVITPAVSKQITIDKGNILESNPEQDEGRLLGTLRMDVGREISNESIWYLKRLVYAYGFWNVELIINFDCPSDRKIELDLLIWATLHPWSIGGEYVQFIYMSTIITIINGSNPQDIHKKVERGVSSHRLWGTRYNLAFSINATLKEYFYYNGKWVQNSEDRIKLSEDDYLYFSPFLRARTYQNENKEADLRITNPFMKLIERFPNLFPILRHLLRL